MPYVASQNQADTHSEAKHSPDGRPQSVNSLYYYSIAQKREVGPAASLQVLFFQF